MKRVLIFLLFLTLALVAPIGVAGAQTGDDGPQPEDFIDPETGEPDLEAYLAAVQASQAGGGTAAASTSAGSGSLPATGSDGATELAIFGAALVATGGVAVVASRRRRRA